MDLSYISVDNRACECLFVSSSVEDVIGYLPEERIGRAGVDLPHPAQVEAIQRLWCAALTAELAGILVQYHFQTKTGEVIPVAAMSCLCGDICISTIAKRQPDSDRDIYRECTAEECFDIDLEGNIRFLNWNAKSSRLRDILAGPFPPISLPVPEPRVAMILNRFTISLAILYVSSEMVLGLEPVSTVGTSFLNYILPSQRRRVEMQIAHIKSLPGLLRIRFGWMIPSAGGNNVRQDQVSLLRALPPPPQLCQGSSLSSLGRSAEPSTATAATPSASQELPSAEFVRWSSAPVPLYERSTSTRRGQRDALVAITSPSSVAASDRELLLASSMNVVECEAQLWSSTDGIVCVIREACGVVSIA